ncbi:MAG: hypothetical protein WBP13_07430 [Methylophilaceae bacterium]
MSPLWPNPFSSQVLVGISPQSVAIIQTAGLNKRVMQKQYALIAKPSIELGWDQALNQLHAKLASMQLSTSKSLNIVLASDFARYLVLPAHHSLMRAGEKVEYARASHREIYGNIAETWHIQCDDAPPNQPTMTVAVDQALIAALTKLAHQYKMRLASVQPYLMPVFNRIKLKLVADQLYFAVVEFGRLLFAHLKNGHWQQIHSFPLGLDWPAQLKNIALREGMSNEKAADFVLMVYAPNHKTTNLPHIAGWTLQRISMDSQSSKGLDPHYAMLEALQ